MLTPPQTPPRAAALAAAGPPAQAPVAPPRGLLHVIIHAAAERLAEHWAVPAESRAAFRSAFVHIVEQQVCAVIGADTVSVTGWVMPPSERLGRRARIVTALEAGEAPRVIAARELVSLRWVQRVRAELDRADPAERTFPP